MIFFIYKKKEIINILKIVNNNYLKIVNNNNSKKVNNK